MKIYKVYIYHIYFQHLSDLNLNENMIAEIPTDITKGPVLQIVRLQNNRLSLDAIPDSIFVESTVS